MDSIVSFVIVNWNRCNDLKECLNSIQDQTYTNFEIIVVDNQSTDGSLKMVRNLFPKVKLIIMPDSFYGACETFNIGFSSSLGEYIAILDNDVIIPSNWVEKILNCFEMEPATTALISSKVIEPGMPEDYLNSSELNSKKYIDTFVGCGSIAKSDLIKEVGYYDKNFFIHVNERDLALKLLNKGYRILHFPEAITFHKKEFGIHMGNRSLYYHIRNYIWVFIKHYSLKFIFLYLIGGFQMFIPVKLRNNKLSRNGILLGTAGLKDAILYNKGGKKTIIIAVIGAFFGIPYCIKKRRVCKSPDLRIP